MSTLTVGVGMQYATIAKAVAASHNNDVIQVQAGTYTNDFFKIDDSITLESIGGMATIAATTTPLESKGIIIVGEAGLNPNVTIEGFVLTGAKISASAGNNGAGIRYESGNLTLDNDVVRNNQDGILATPYVANTGTIIVNTSTFSANGAGDGQSHNLYINQVARFTFEDSVSVGAIVGHDIKSRASSTTIIEQHDRRRSDGHGLLRDRPAERRQGTDPGQHDRAGSRHAKSDHHLLRRGGRPDRRIDPDRHRQHDPQRPELREFAGYPQPDGGGRIRHQQPVLWADRRQTRVQARRRCRATPCSRLNRHFSVLAAVAGVVAAAGVVAGAGAGAPSQR